MSLCEVEEYEENTLAISKHAYDRMKSRNGWNKKAADRMVGRVYSDGLRPGQVKGYLKGWVNHKNENNVEGKEFILFGEKLYVFCDGIMLTVLQAPGRSYLLHECTY